MANLTLKNQKTEALRAAAREVKLNIDVDAATREELIEELEKYADEKAKEKDNPAKEEEQEPTSDMMQISKSEFAQLMEEFMRPQTERIQQLEAALKQKEAAPAQAGVPDALQLMMKTMIAEIRGEVNKKGQVRAETNRGPENVLENEARFWVRSPNFKMSELLIGAQPQELPYGMKEIRFTRVIGPVAMKDPQFPIPQVVIILQYKTKDKYLAEQIRRDARYGSRIFEDTNDLMRAPAGMEFHMAKERHLVALRTNEDPNYVFSEAKKEGIPYAMGDNPERLRFQIAHARATREFGAIVNNLRTEEDKRRREASLGMGNAGIPSGTVAAG